MVGPLGQAVLGCIEKLARHEPESSILPWFLVQVPALNSLSDGQ